MIEPPKALLVVNIRELALIYDLAQEASQDTSKHTSDRETASQLYGKCAEIFGAE